MTFEVKGLGEVKRRLRQLQDNARKLEGESAVAFSDLFRPEFMKTHTEFPDWEAFALESGIFPDNQINQETFQAIPDEAWDRWVAESSHFESWQDMMGKAASEYIQRQLFEG